MNAMNSEQTNNAEPQATEADAYDVFDDLDALANERQRPVMLLNGDIDDGAADDSLTKTVIEVGVDTALAFSGYKQVSVLLNSLGGSPTATYKMILALRHQVDDIEVLVPREAKSAATLFCLGADTIYMGRKGELGPLDPQMPDRTGRSRQVSALETFKGLEQLLDHSLEAFDSIMRLLLQSAPVDIPNAMERAQPLFAAIVSPLYQNVDLHELGEAGRHLAEIEAYASRIMTRWSYRNSRHTQEIIRRLIWEYPSHGFVIDLAEAIGIGLKAKPMSSAAEEISKRILGTGINFGVGHLKSTASMSNNLDCNIPDTGKEGEDGETE